MSTIPLELEQLFNKHKRKLLGIARMVTRSNEDAEEVVQDTYLRAFIRYSKEGIGNSMRPWIYSITKNAAISKLRHNKSTYRKIDAYREYKEYIENTDNINNEVRGIRKKVEEREVLELFKQAYENLVPKHREVLELRIIKELNHREIAEKLNISIGTAKSRVSYARAYLLAEIDSLVTYRDNI